MGGARVAAVVRRVVLLVVLVLVVGCTATAAPRERPARPGPAAAESRPNLVVVLVDDMRSDELRFLPQTRRLLGARGVRFPRAISPHPVCCPARAGLLTGQYAQNHGVRHNFGRYGGYPAFRHAENTLPVWLSRSGYRTHYIGKYLNRYAGTTPPEPGWDGWDALLPPTAVYRSFRFHGQRARQHGYVTRAIERRTDAAVDELAGERPFLLFVSHTAPHDEQRPGKAQRPPVPERRYARLPVPLRQLRFLQDPAFDEPDVGDLPRRLRLPPVDRAQLIRDARARARSLRSVDDAVASLVARLRASGELDSTWIVFTSDNGYQLGEHRMLHKNQLMRQSLDVPLLVSGPGVADPGAAVRGVTPSLVDLPATLLDLAGVDPGRPQDGRSLLPFLEGGRPEWRDTTLVQTGRRGLLGRQPGWRYRGVQTGRYLYAVDVARDPGGDYLFDRLRDPHELRNVVADPRYRAVVAELRRRVEALQDCAGAACNRDWGPLPRPSA